jgi:hypothetical protein
VLLSVAKIGVWIGVWDTYIFQSNDKTPDSNVCSRRGFLFVRGAPSVVSHERRKSESQSVSVAAVGTLGEAGSAMTSTNAHSLNRRACE